MMSRLTFQMDNLEDVENYIVASKQSAMASPNPKMGFLRTPLMDVNNRMDKRKSIIIQCDTPRTKSALRTKHQDLHTHNAQLKTSNKIQREEIESLELQLSQERCKVTELEETIQALEQKCDAMVKSLQNPDSYYHSYCKAQQLVLELHAEKREFEGLMSDIEQTADLQSRMKTKLVQAAEKIVAFSKDNNLVNKLREDIASLQVQNAKFQEQLSTSVSEKESMGGDLKLMQSLLTQSNNNLVELDEKWHQVHQQMKEYRDQITQLEADNASVTQAFNVMMKDKIKTEQELIECKEEFERFKHVSGDTQEKFELYIETLQHTLDRWEVDREVAEEEAADYRREVLSQQHAMKEMNAELTILRMKKQEWHHHQDELEELKSSNQFLEAEKEFYTSAITDYRMKLEAEVDLSKSNQCLISTLKSSIDELQCSHDQLKMDFDSLQEELVYANEKTSTLSAVLVQIHKRVEDTVVNLQNKFGVKLSSESAMRSMKGRSSQTPRLDQAHNNNGSFVQEILSPADDHDERNSPRSERKKIMRNDNSMTQSSDRCSTSKRLKQDNVEFLSSSRKCGMHQPVVYRSESLSVSSTGHETKVTSRRCLSFTHSEVSQSIPKDGTPQSEKAKCHVIADNSSTSGHDDQQVSSPGFAVIRHIPSTLERTADTDKPGNNSATREDDCDVIEQCEYIMDSIDNMLTLIIRTSHIVDRASKLGMRDLKGEIEILHDKLSIRNEKIEELEKDLNTKNQEVNSMKDEMEHMSQRVTSMTQAILKHEDLGYDIQRLEEEKEEWKLKEKRLTGEVNLLSRQLEEITQQSNAKPGQVRDGACLKDIIALKKKNHQLECQIYEEVERSKQATAKAIRRLRITEDNWQKAEAEIQDLDDIIQAIGKVCRDKSSTRQNPAFLQIIHLIDGHTD